MNTDRSAIARRLLVGTGIVLLIPSLIWFALAILGLVSSDAVAIGESSGIKTIAAIAVSGCLVTAVGYSSDHERNQP